MSEWILALILTWRPTTEPAEERRYESIAVDMAEAVEGIGGDDSLALTVLAVAMHESGMRAEVDDGRERGSGRDVCLMQIRTTKRKADALAADRRECIRLGARYVRGSLASCRALPWEYRLAAYASGSCERGHAASAEIMGIRAAMRDRLSFLRRAGALGAHRE
jgi:hypothetical protein